MTKPILFTFPGACSRVTLSALEEAGVDYEARWLNLAANAQSSDDYVAFNRKGKVPALVVDGKTLTENAAILHYLHVTNPDANLLPVGTAFDNATALSDLVWCGSVLHPMVRQIVNPKKWTTGDTDGIRADGIEKLAGECSYIDSRLSQANWWYGERWSITDVYIYWACSTAAKAGFPNGGYPAIAAHAQRVRARASFQRALVLEVAAVEQNKFAMDATKL